MQSRFESKRMVGKCLTRSLDLTDKAVRSAPTPLVIPHKTHICFASRSRTAEGFVRLTSWFGGQMVPTLIGWIIVGPGEGHQQLLHDAVIVPFLGGGQRFLDPVVAGDDGGIVGPHEAAGFLG